MYRIYAPLMALLMVVFFALACSSADTPVAPDSTGTTTQNSMQTSQTVLWGYYNVYMDIENETVEAVMNRNAMHTLNINKFLNNNPLTLSFSFNDVSPNPGAGYIDVDLDVTITHPIPGAEKFNGYDVRGTLIADAGETMSYNADLQYPVLGTNQVLTNADGYTRWFNKTEFTVESVGGYTPGLYGSANLTGDATLNGYKYFTDGLGSTEMDVVSYLNTNDADNGVFTSGEENTRAYQIRFPIPTPGVQYDYAITASWNGGQPGDHPANCPEGVACNADITEDLWYVSGTENGGSIIADVTIFGWDGNPSSIKIESTVLGSVYALTAGEMTPTATGTHWATYSFEVEETALSAIDGQEMFVIAEYNGVDYSGPFGIPNAAGTDTMAAIFRFDLPVGDSSPNAAPVVTSGVSGEDEPVVDTIEQYTVVANDPDAGDTLTYDWSVYEHGTTTEVWSDPSDTSGQVNIDFSGFTANIDDQFDIACSVSDGTDATDATTLTVTIIDTPNQMPVVTSGVDGPATPGPTDLSQYSITANDPEGDTLTYDWVIRDLGTGDVKYNGPGNGDGTMDVDWLFIGATSGADYMISASVADPYNPPVTALPIIIIIS